MKKEFKPSIKKVIHIGDELRFQREYYCYKNNVRLPLKVLSSQKENDNRKCLQDVLYDFMKENIEFDTEFGTSYDVLYAIENGKSKKKGESYNPNTHFLRIYCLFKIYNFLDSLRILELMTEKYELEPQYETTFVTMLNVVEGNSVEEFLVQGRRDKILKVNLKYGRIIVTKDTYLQLCGEKTRKEIELKYEKWYQQEHYKEKYENGELVEKIKIDNPDEEFIFGFDFKELIKELQSKMKKLSLIEQYCLSLDLGENTSYIPDFINGNLQNIYIDTFKKTLKHFNIINEQLNDILEIVMKNIDKEVFKGLETF